MIDISKFDATDTPPRPNGNTYWVVPHKFLAGEYPGNKDPVKARKKIKQFLAAGIRHFIDLTEHSRKNLVGGISSVRRDSLRGSPELEH